jgi:hypothetical protein
MAIHAVHCPVSGEQVTQVTNFDGDVQRVICREYDGVGTCRLMRAALQAGPLAQLLERNRERTLSRHDTRCVLRAAP